MASLAPIRVALRVAAACAIVAACSVSAGARSTPMPPDEFGARPAASVAAHVSRSEIPEQHAAAMVPISCSPTKPAARFVPPPDYPAPLQPPAPDKSWYGSARLWVMLDKNGEAWVRLPQASDGTLTQKTFWWSADFDVNKEPEPAISVQGRQLDGTAHFLIGGPGTNAQADFGSAMLVGIDIPGSGCWEVTGAYRGAMLSYVVWAAP
jgi:hypothetical protein